MKKLRRHNKSVIIDRFIFAFCLFGDVTFSEYFLYHYRFLLESTSYVLSFRMVFFYLVTTGWIFDISLLCESSIKSVSMIIASSPETVDCMNHKKKEYSPLQAANLINKRRDGLVFTLTSI